MQKYKCFIKERKPWNLFKVSSKLLINILFEYYFYNKYKVDNINCIIKQVKYYFVIRDHSEKEKVVRTKEQLEAIEEFNKMQRMTRSSSFGKLR